jgi:hypothetical protein
MRHLPSPLGWRPRDNLAKVAILPAIKNFLGRDEQIGRREPQAQVFVLQQRKLVIVVILDCDFVDRPPTVVRYGDQLSCLSLSSSSSQQPSWTPLQQQRSA